MFSHVGESVTLLGELDQRYSKVCSARGDIPYSPGDEQRQWWSKVKDKEVGEQDQVEFCWFPTVQRTINNVTCVGA